MKILFKRKPTDADKARSSNAPAATTYREGDQPVAKNVTITIRDADGNLIPVTGYSETEYDDWSWRGR